MEDDTETKNQLLPARDQRTNSNVEQNYTKFYFSKRFLIAIMLFTGEIFQVTLRTNLSIAIVDMTMDENTSLTNESVAKDLKFDWSSSQKGIVLSAFSYGYLFAPIGGMLASRFGGVNTFGIGIMLTALTTLLTPFLITFHFYLFIFSRVLEGMSEGIATASFPEIWSRWASAEERPKLTCVSLLGFYFGAMISFPLAGYIALHWGWPTIFYSSGCVPLIWYIFWFIFLANDPAEDKFISEAERKFLKSKINRELNDKVLTRYIFLAQVAYSWKSMLLSLPVWAIFINRFTIGCGQIIMLFNLPQYIKDTSNVDISEIGYISSLPHICGVFAVLFSSLATDYLRNSKIINFTQVHKIFMCSGCLVGALTYVGILFTDFRGSIICLSLNRFFLSCTEVVFTVSLLDMAPRHASLISGLATAFYTLSAILVPTFVGYTVKTRSVSEWNVCFITFSLAYVFGAVFYLRYGSGELQYWDDGSETKYDKKKLEKKENLYYPDL